MNEKQVYKAIEEAYRLGLRDGNSNKNFRPFLIASQITAHEIAKKYIDIPKNNPK